jgi:trimeric autotransporter adhesin
LALLNGVQISAVTVSPNTLDLVFFGSTAGRIIKVENASSAAPTATNITGNLAATGNISSIAVQEGNDNHILITLSNFGVNSIHETTNGGTTWTSIEGNFTTDVPVRCIMFNPQNTDQALIGTDIGVYSTDDLNGTATVWGETNSGLARVSVHYLEYRKCDKTIIAFTHGRGVFTTSSLESPIIKFDGSSAYKKETVSNNTTATCKPYVDVNVPVVLTKTANANATVSVTLGGTATLGKDYDIITPTPLSVSAAGTTNVVVRIYNDTEIETDETITFTLNINNPLATNARLGCVNSPYSITIISDDYTPSNYVKKYLTENWEGAITGWTGIGGGTSASPNAWGILSTCATSIENNTAIIYNRFTNNCIYNNTITTNKVLYKQTSLPTGVTNPAINFEWTGVGESEGATNYDYAEIVYSTNTTTPIWIAVTGIPRLNNNNTKRYATYSLPNALIGTNFLIGFRWINDAAVGAATSIGIDNIEITAQSPALVQIANNTATANNIFVDANATVHFYDVSGNVMATLKNNNSTVLGCVKVEINRAGNNANVPFWNNNTANYVASKSIKVSAPDAPATGISYDITAYYSQAEINTYTAGSGQSSTSLSLLKIASPLSAVDITPSTPNASSVTSTIATRAAYNTNDFTYTANFTSFSGFTLGVSGVPIPLKFASFTGKALNGSNQLEWRTFYEQESTGFELEKSNDGINFNMAATVNSKGNTSIGHNYNYIDNAPYAKTYYRLKFVNELGQIQYTNIVTLDQLSDKIVTVLPNPFTNKITIKYHEAVTGNVIYKLIDSKGSEVLKVQHNLQGQLLDNILQVQHLPKGIYTLLILKDDKTIHKQIQKGE